MKTARLSVAAIGVVAATVLAASAATSGATTTSNGTSYSAAASAGPVGSITPTVKVCPLSLLGLLGSCSTGALSTVTSLLGSLLTPVSTIVSGIQTLPSSVVTALTGSGLSASQPAAQLTRPNPTNDPSTGVLNLPTCGQQGWDANGAGDCYTGLPVTIPASALLGLNVTGVAGYATDDSTGYIGAAQAAGVKMSLLGGSLGTIGTVWSRARCSNSSSAPNCDAANSTVTASFLPSSAYPSGALSVKIANNADPQVLSLNGAPLSAVNKTVSVVGVGTVTVAVTNHLLTLSIALSASQLTSLLPSLSGLSGLVSDTATVTIGIGPGSTSTASGASASGLTISADASLDIKLSVLGLASVEITAGAGISSPDLLNLSLAYSAATAGPAVASWIPPGLI